MFPPTTTRYLEPDDVFAVARVSDRFVCVFLPGSFVVYYNGRIRSFYLNDEPSTPISSRHLSSLLNILRHDVFPGDEF